MCVYFAPFFPFTVCVVETLFHSLTLPFLLLSQEARAREVGELQGQLKATRSNLQLNEDALQRLRNEKFNATQEYVSWKEREREREREREISY